MGDLRLRGRAPEGRPGDVPARLEAGHAVAAPGATVRRSGAVIRELGRSMALLAFAGLSVGGGLSLVVVAFHALGR